LFSISQKNASLNSLSDSQSINHSLKSQSAKFASTLSSLVLFPQYHRVHVISYSNFALFASVSPLPLVASESSAGRLAPAETGSCAAA
jgi:hypothetical protein